MFLLGGLVTFFGIYVFTKHFVKNKVEDVTNLVNNILEFPKNKVEDATNLVNNILDFPKDKRK